MKSSHEDKCGAGLGAAKIALPPEQTFKTLVVKGDCAGVCFAQKEVFPLTGYVRGGVTALAAKKDYPVLADETIILFTTISVSAGVRGAQILLAPAD